MSELIRCPCGQVMQITPELRGQIVKCPKCQMQLQAPGGEPSETKRTRARGGSMFGWLVKTVVMVLFVVVGLGYAAWKAGILNKIQQGAGGPAYQFSAPPEADDSAIEVVDETVRASGDPANVLDTTAGRPQARIRMAVKKIRPSDLVLELKSGSVGGLGVGSNIAHLRALHGGLPYARVGDAYYCKEAGLRVEVHKERVFRVVIAVAPQKLDGRDLNQYPGQMVPQIGQREARKSIVKILGRVTSEDATSMTFNTVRRDRLRFQFGQTGLLQTVTLEAQPDFFSYDKMSRATPVIYPDAKPVTLPQWSGNANFDFGRKMCVGMPLGAHHSKIVGLPKELVINSVEGKAYFAPAGLILDVRDSAISYIEVYVRPEFQETPLKPFTGSFSHGVTKATTASELRELLGAESGHGEDERFVSLYYRLDDCFLRFRFSPSDGKLVSAGMGLATFRQDMQISRKLEGVTGIVQQAAVWRGQRRVASMKAGEPLKTVGETQDFYGVKVGDRFGWISKGDARRTSDGAVWLESVQKFRFRKGQETAQLIDAIFTSDSNTVVATGERTAGIGRPAGVLHIYSGNSGKPTRTYSGNVAQNVFPASTSGGFVSVSSGAQKLSFSAYGQDPNKPTAVNRLDHDKRVVASFLRTDEGGAVCAVVWPQSISLVRLPDASVLKTLTTGDRILDVAVAGGGSEVWILHPRSVVRLEVNSGQQTSIPISGRRFLYKVPRSHVMLAITQGKVGRLPLVAGFETRTGRMIWQSDEFTLAPPKIGGASSQGTTLVALSTRSTMSAVVVNPATGIINQTIELGDERPSNLRGLKLSADGRRLLYFYESGELHTAELGGTDAIVTRHGFAREYHPTSLTDDGRTFAVSDANRVYIYKGKSATPSKVIDTTSQLTALEISHGGAFVAGGDGAGRVYLWDTGSGRLIHTLADDSRKRARIRKIRFTPDEKRVLFSTSGSPSLVMNDVSPPYLRSEFLQQSVVSDFEVSADGAKCLSIGVGAATRVYLWNLRGKQRELGIGIAQAAESGQIAFSPDMEAAHFALDGSLFNLSLGEGAKRQPHKFDLPAPYKSGPGLLSPDGRHFYRFEEKGVRVWDILRREPIAFSTNMNTVDQWKFSPRGASLALALSGEIEVLRLGQGGK